MNRIRLSSVVFVVIGLATVLGCESRSPADVALDVDAPPAYGMFGGSAAVDLEKYTAGVDADEAPGPSLVPGEIVVWEYRIKNTGDVGIVSVLVTDDREGSICLTGSLAPGEETVCEHSGIVEPGEYSNTGTATATAQTLFGLTMVTDQDMSHYVGGLASQAAMTVRIDVKPGSDENRINARSKGRVPVAILSSGESVETDESKTPGGPDASILTFGPFDPSNADPETIGIGPGQVPEGVLEAAGEELAVTPVHVAPTEDLNRDGIPDLILHFKTRDLCRAGLLAADVTEWVLSGETFEGEPFSGSDEIHLLRGKPCT
jgi:hypothetical protein